MQDLVLERLEVAVQLPRMGCQEGLEITSHDNVTLVCFDVIELLDTALHCCENGRQVGSRDGEKVQGEALRVFIMHLRLI